MLENVLENKMNIDCGVFVCLSSDNPISEKEVRDVVEQILQQAW